MLSKLSIHALIQNLFELCKSNSKTRFVFSDCMNAPRNENICKELCQLCKYAMSYWMETFMIRLLYLFAYCYFRFRPLLPVWLFWLVTSLSVWPIWLTSLSSLTYWNLDRSNRCGLFLILTFPHLKIVTSSTGYLLNWLKLLEYQHLEPVWHFNNTFSTSIRFNLFW